MQVQRDAGKVLSRWHGKPPLPPPPNTSHTPNCVRACHTACHTCHKFPYHHNSPPNRILLGACLEETGKPRSSRLSTTQRMLQLGLFIWASFAALFARSPTPHAELPSASSCFPHKASWRRDVWVNVPKSQRLSQCIWHYVRR